ncbi:MAG TPA: hypothetical protein VM597_34185 [Gemmataceae bacterium]|nr:hypothetical protein [Gemmataceae bacterium]
MSRPRLTAVVLALLAGCGTRTPAPETVVRGQVLYRGEAVAGGLVVFAPNPDRGADGPLAAAAIQSDGTFQLDAESARGLTGRWYRVAVAPAAGTVDVPTAERPYPGLPARYRNPDRSGLACEVKPGTEQVFRFLLDD